VFHVNDNSINPRITYLNLFVYVVAMGRNKARSKAWWVILGGSMSFRTAYQEKPKNWENGYEQPVTPRLKNTLNGLGKGF